MEAASWGLQAHLFARIMPIKALMDNTKVNIGITGHQRLDAPSKWEWVKREIERLLTQNTLPLVGVTSLAIGADQLFAKCVLELGGELMAIIPFVNYERTFTE